MSILLDEQIDVRMKASLPDLPVFTVLDKDWTGLKNGELREKLNQENYRYFITADKIYHSSRIYRLFILPLF